MSLGSSASIPRPARSCGAPESSPGKIFAPVSAVPGVAFVATDRGRLLAVDTTTGEELWGYDAPAPVGGRAVDRRRPGGVGLRLHAVRRSGRGRGPLLHGRGLTVRRRGIVRRGAIAASVLLLAARLLLGWRRRRSADHDRGGARGGRPPLGSVLGVRRAARRLRRGVGPDARVGRRRADVPGGPPRVLRRHDAASDRPRSARPQHQPHVRLRNLRLPRDGRDLRLHRRHPLRAAERPHPLLERGPGRRQLRRRSSSTSCSTTSRPRSAWTQGRCSRPACPMARRCPRCWRAGLPERIAAIGAVAGVEFLEPCDGAPVPVVAFHGTEDPILPYAGGGLNATTDRRAELLRRGAPGRAPGAARAWTSRWRRWAAHNGCSPEPVDERVSPEVRRRTWPGCEAATVLYIVDGGGHTWPGKPFPQFEASFGATTTDIDATSLIFELFFEDGEPAA